MAVDEFSCSFYPFSYSEDLNSLDDIHPVWEPLTPTDEHMNFL